LAVCQVYGCAAARRLAEIYVWFFRGVPILVLLFLFYGLFIALNLPAAPFLICSVTLGMTSTAYQSQIYRGAIQSLPKGQLNAARALGMGDKTAVACIILPQALRLSIPGFANEFSILLKDSAICFVLGAQDIMARAGFVAARTHEHLALYAAAGLLYFALTHIVVKLLLRLERHFRIPDYAVEGGGRS
jgi:polar amino acid transport system permease protein